MEARLETGISMTSSAAEPQVRQLTCAYIYICMLGTMEFSLQSLMDFLNRNEGIELPPPQAIAL